MNLFNCFLNLSRLLASTTSCGNEFQFNYVLHEKILPFCEGNYFLKKKKTPKKTSPKTINQHLSLCKTSSGSSVRALDCIQLSPSGLLQRLLPRLLDKAAGEKGGVLHHGGG